MRRLGFRLLVGMTLLGMPVCAQDIPVVDTDSLATDSLAIDSLNMDPEWYVAPLVREADFAPRRAAVANCPVDSVLTFNVDSILSEVTVYEYGDTTRTMVWTVNADGSRVGKSRTESASTATTSYSATYAWDANTNNWKGTSKEEHTYTGSKETLRILYNTWQNNAWVADTKYTWVYDASLRETEYTTYTRNASTNELVLSKQRIREYNAAGKTTLDIQYTAHNGTSWSAGTKKIYDFDASGNQIEYTYYSSLSNGNWVGSTHEKWTYTSGKKTYYEKQTWSNGGWVNSSKEVWSFNASGKQILHEKYGVSNGEWQISLQENSSYDDANNNTSVENYTYTNGVQKGSKKEDYTWNASKKKTNTYTYKWTNGGWVYYQWIVSDYDAAGNAIESCRYNWLNEVWVGIETRTQKVYTEGKLSTVLISTWSTDYSTWAFNSKHIYAYDNSGRTIGDTMQYYSDSQWVNYTLTTHTFDAKGNDTLSVSSSWNGTEWTATSVTKGTYTYTSSGKLSFILVLTSLGDNWVGQQKAEYTYNDADLQTFYALYDWNNGGWRCTNKNIKTYDSQNHLILDETYRLNNSVLSKVDKYVYAYDEYDHQYMSAYYVGDGATWKGISHTEKSLDARGTVLSTISYTWNNSTYEWDYTFKYDYTYDEAGRTIKQVISRFQNNSWSEEQRFTKEYDARGQEISSREYRKIGGDLKIVSLRDKIYDSLDNKLRRELTGTWNNSTGSLSAYIDNHYSYACDPHFYTIRFVNYDGTELESVKLAEGETPSYSGAEPSKPASAEYAYAFSGWTPEIAAVTGNATYTATFTGTKRTYTITWLNEDGSEIEHETLEYGATPAHADLSKDNTAEYTYNFKGWKPGIGIVTGDATYTADFDSIKNKYTITWVDDNDVQLDQMTIEYGVMPEHADAEKAATAEWTYSFTGWTPAIVSVTGNATYKATFSQTKNSYTVTWVDENDIEISHETLEYGANPTHVDLSKDNTAEWTYAFTGWTPAITSVTGNATYTATFSQTKNKYVITFLNYDETELQSSEVEYGVTPEFTCATPTKPADAQGTYTFTGWDEELVAVTGAKTYTAQFISTANKYTIIFQNYDGTELQSSEVAYGETPSYTGATPTKPADAQDTYNFAGWDPQVVPVTGTATYTAQYTSTVNSYTIKFMNGETELQSSEVAYGEMPVYEGATPTKDATDEFTYTFAGWNPAVTSVKGDASYTATFTATKRNYTITWLNEDGSELSHETLEYGAIPQHTDATKENTAEYTYSFTGWSPEVTSVTGDATYTAQFNATKNSYKITWMDDDDSLIDETYVLYGIVPTHTAPTKEATDEHSYFFDKWTPDVVAVTGEATYKASYTETTKVYTITWLNENGTEISHETLEYGATPTHTAPTKEATDEFTYTFAGWNPAITSVTGDASYTASFTATKRSYTITWLNEDGSELSHETLEYGAIPQHTDATKENTEEYTYSFTGWSPDIASVTGDATYTAQFNATKNSYKITWMDDDDSLIDETYVLYGIVPTHTAPTKEATDEHSYFFDKWTPDVVAVTGEATYKATYTETTKVYTITWLNENGTEISHETLEYGATPTHTAPTKEATDEFTYTFAGWNPAVTSVTGDASYTATFTATKRSYTITWLNENGTEIDHTTVEYGVTPTHADATKENTLEYTYTFSGWTPQVVAVTGDATYTATFSSTANTYIITWKDENGITLDQTTVTAGTLPAHADPVKQNTAEYTYAFTGWSPEVVAAVADATYQATFSATKNSYTITFKNDDGSVLTSQAWEYGATPTCTPPTKQSTAEYTYTFAGWDKTIVSVTAEATYMATYNATKNSYEITWLNDDNSLIDKTTVEYGLTPQHADASKQNTAEWTYAFTGWTPAIVDVTGDATYKATFSQTKNTYVITFLNYDGTELQTGDVEYGVVPTYTSATPTKPADAQGTYTFAGWDEEITAVTGAKTYTATFTGVKGTYTITFYFGDGVTILAQMELAYGEMPEMTLEPARLADPEFSYTFAGWEPAIAPVTADADYVAVYTATTNSYTIIFRNDDGTELQREVLEYGILPIYAGEEPTKEEDERYTYEFAGWKPAVDIAKADAVYTATYTATKKKKQGIEDVVEAGAQATKIYIEGNIYILRAGHAYAPDGTKIK